MHKNNDIWYGTCSYWTDDWDKLASHEHEHGGIPCCPVCGAVGFISDKTKWYEGAKKFESDGHPRYVEFLDLNKEKCLPTGFLTSYKLWIAKEMPDEKA